MKNKQLIGVRLTERQLTCLRDEAERLGITLSEMIRKIIDWHIDGELLR